MQVTFDPADRDDRVRAVEIIAAMEDLESFVENVEEADQAAGTSDAPLDVNDFVDHAGEGSLELIGLALKHFGPDNEFTFEELGARSKVPIGKLKAMHRNLGRTARALGGKIENILPARWDDNAGRQHYHVPAALQAALPTK